MQELDVSQQWGLRSRRLRPLFLLAKKRVVFVAQECEDGYAHADDKHGEDDRAVSDIATSINRFGALTAVRHSIVARSTKNLYIPTIFIV